MDEEEIQKMLDFIKENYGITVERTLESKIVQKFGVKKLDELLDRGLVYEPIRGWIKVI